MISYFFTVSNSVEQKSLSTENSCDPSALGLVDYSSSEEGEGGRKKSKPDDSTSTEEVDHHVVTQERFERLTQQASMDDTSKDVENIEAGTSQSNIRTSDENDKSLTQSGRKRKYAARATSETRVQIVQAARDGRDWVFVAQQLGIKRSTAQTWVSKNSTTLKPMGGVRYTKMEPYHEDYMRSWLQTTPNITLRDMREKLEQQCNLKVCTSTIDNHLDGMEFTIKLNTPDFHMDSVNSESTKEKRYTYVKSLLDVVTDRKKHVAFVGETNFNIYTKRSNGKRSFPNGPREPSRLPSSKGPKVHLAGAISTQGLDYLEMKRGSFNEVELATFCATLLRKLVSDRGLEMKDLVLVLDHGDNYRECQKLIQGADEFQGVVVLR